MSTHAVDTVQGRFATAVAAHPDQVAVRFLHPTAGDTEWSYAQLLQRSDHVAEALRSAGARRGDRVLLVLPSDLDTVRGFLGCLRAGTIPVPVQLTAASRTAAALDRLGAVVADADPAVLLVPPDTVEEVAGHPAAAGRVVLGVDGAAVRTPPGPRPTVPPQGPDAEGLVFLQYTSGSTGNPKGVRNTHAALLHQVELFRDIWPGDEPIHMASWLPLHHDMGLILGLLTPLLTGGTCTLMTPASFVSRPGRWLSAASRLRANWLAAPDLGWQRCCDAVPAEEVAGLDLSAVRYAMNGAEPIRPATLERFCRHFAAAGFRADAMTPGYGLAEACLTVSVSGRPRGYRLGSYDPAALAGGTAGPVPAGTGRTLVGCGDRFAFERVAVADPDSGAELPERAVGEIWVAGPGLPDGYWNAPDATARTFGARLADGSGPFLRTGDLGFLDGGELYVCGRIRDLVIRSGVNHLPNDMEATLEQRVPEVRIGGACVAQDGDGVVRILLEVPTRLSVDERAAAAAAARRAVLEGHDLAPDEVVLVPRGTLLRTTSGKLRRAATVELFGTGTRQVLHADRAGGPLDPAGLADLVGGLLDLPPAAIRPEDDLVALGLTSAAIAEVAAGLVAAGRPVGIADLAGRPTLGAWVQLLSGTPAGGPPPAIEPAGPFALTPLQYAYWIGRRDDQPLGGIGCHAYLELHGQDVDPARLDSAMRAVLARHGMLRARFLADGRQEVLAETRWPGLTVHDLRDRSPEAAARAAERLREGLATRVLDVAAGEVVDLQLILLPGGGTRVLLDADLLVADATSIGVVLADLGAAYAGRDLPPPPAPSFAGYLAARAAARDGAGQAARAYWQDRLPELPGPPELPLAGDPRRMVRPRFSRRADRLTAAEWAALTSRARRHGLTPAVVLAAAYVEVLAAWSASPRFTVAVTLFGREPAAGAAPDLVGDFSTLVLLAVDGGAGGSFPDRARALRDRLTADLGASDYSGVDVLRDLARQRGGEPARAPVVFTCNLDGDLVPAAARTRLGEPGWMSSRTPQVWLDHQVHRLDGEVLLSWDAVDDLFPAGLLDAFTGAHADLLRGLAAADWDGLTPDLLPTDQRRVRAAANDTDGPLPDALLHSAFFSRAAAAPDRAALLWGETGRLDAGPLADRALRLAAVLRQRGLRPGDAVLLSMPKGPDLVVAVLGVLAAGGVYVPVGVEQPAVRRDRIATRAGVRLRLTELPDFAGVAPLTAPVPTDPGATAYVIFTSGSTGEPKGVEVAHRSAVNTVLDINDRYGVGPGDRVLAVSALDFDLSVYDLFGLLSSGGALVLIGEDERRDAQRWGELARRHGVTVWNTVPVLFDMLVTTAQTGGGLPASLRLVLVSGDWVGLDLRPRLTALLPDCRLIALGGATEAAIWSNAHEVEASRPGWVSVPYGRPLRNQRYRVVDPLGGDRPDWVPGELWIGGAGVALGYRGDPARTADRFVAHAGRRWYRTGDLGRYWPDGTLEFLGRADRQVKLRGHRIELGEVDAACESFPAVRQATAAVVGDPRQLGVVVAAPEHLDRAALDRWLADRLPGFMVPHRILVVGALPLSANGKVDRAAAARLLEGVAPRPLPRRRSPEGAVEEAVAAVWASLLHVPTVSADDDFFLLGGDSLLATRLLDQLARAGVTGADLAGLFACPVLRDFATGLGRAAAGQPRPAGLPADPAHRYEPFPLTAVQRAYWIGRSDRLPLGGIGTTFYAELDVVDLDTGRLESAWKQLVDRHDMLRASLDPDGRQRVQRQVGAVRIPVRDAGPDPRPALAELRDALSRLVHDPRHWPLFAVRGVRHGRTTRLGISLDYLVLDGMSIAVLLAELADLYAGRPLPAPPGMSFRDYVVADPSAGPERAAAERHWRDRLADLPPAPRLPLAVEPASAGRPRFVHREATVPATEWREVVERCRAAGVTPSAVLLACYAETLGAWAGQPDLTVHLTLFDRREVHPDIGRVVGDFTALLLLGCSRVPGETWLATVRRLQERLFADLGHRAVPSLDVLRERARRHGGGDVGAMPVVFTSTLGLAGDLLDRLATGLAAPGYTLTSTPQVWLDCQVRESGPDLLLAWDAVEQLFDPGVLDERFGGFVEAVRRLVRQDWATWVPGQPTVHSGTLPAGAELEHLLEQHPDVAEVAVAAGAGAGAGAPVVAVVPAVPAVPTPPARDLPPGPASAGEDEMEARLVESLLLAVLTDGLGCRLDGDLPMVAEGQRPVLRRWLDWLAGRGVLSGPDGPRPGARHDEVADGDRFRVVRAAAAGTPLAPIAGLGPAGVAAALVPVLRGERDPLTLVDHPVLAPEVVVAGRPETAAGLARIVDRLARRAAGGRPHRVVELGGGTGLLAEQILAALAPGSVSYTMLDPSPALLAAAGRRLAGTGHAVSLQRLPAHRVPDELRNDADTVLLLGSLHRFARVTAGAAAAAQLVAPGGHVLVLEPVTEPPVALLSAVPTEQGFAGLDEQRAGRRSPLLPAGEWRRVLAGAGLHTGEPELLGSAVLLPAERPQAAPTPDPAGLRDWLSARLPAHDLPERIVLLTELPRRPDGDVDRDAVRRAAEQAGPAHRAPGTGIPPHGPVEELVAAVWGDVLGVDRVSRDDDFFLLGGDSLLATRTAARLTAAGVPEVELAALFTRPVLADFAATLSPADPDLSAVPGGPGPAALRPDPGARFEPFPLTEVQQAYWIGRSPDLPLGGVGAHCYFEFDGPDVDLGRLEDAWNRVIARHDMLRAVLGDDGTQQVLPAVPRFAIPAVDAPSGDPEPALARLRDELSHQVLDVGTWPLLDVRAVRHGNRTRIGVSLDNVILDGLSMMTVLGEVARLYADPRVALPPVELTFRDYVLAAAGHPGRRAAAEAHWRRRLAELPPAPRLPLAVDPGELGRPRFRRLETRITADRWERIRDRARTAGLTPSALLLTCYAEVLSAAAAQPELTVNLTLFDRRELHPHVDRVLGDFTSLLLVAYRPGATVLDAARRLQEEMAHDLEHRDVSAVWVLRELARLRSRRGEPADPAAMPVVFTSALGLGSGDLPDGFPAEVWGISQTPQVWLDHQVHTAGGELVLRWDSVAGLFPPGLLEAAFAAYGDRVDGLADGDWDQPAAPIVLPAVPRSAVRAVPVSGSDPVPDDDGPPRSATEAALAAVWTELLGVPAVGRRQNFFVLGGDSLLATRMAAVVRTRYGLDVPLRRLFEAPTVAGLAGLVEDAGVDRIETDVVEGAL